MMAIRAGFCKNVSTSKAHWFKHGTKTIRPAVLLELLFTLCCTLSMEVTVNEMTSASPDSLGTSRHASDGLFHCPEGWTLNRDKCFKLITAPMNWLQAQLQCERHGGVLAQTDHVKDSIWLDSFVISFFSNLTDLDKRPTGISFEITNISVWIGVVRLRNGSLYWPLGPTPEDENRDAQEYKDLFDTGSKPAMADCVCLQNAPYSNARLSRCMRPCVEKKASVCVLNACDVTKVQCMHQNKCIGQHQVCDGLVDCRNGSDEKQCDKGRSGMETPSSSNPSTCGAIYKANEGKIRSPGSPTIYPPFSKCIWTIETDPSLHIIIKIESLDIEEIYDTIEVFDGVTVSNSLLLTFLDGFHQDEVIRTSGNFATVQFLSDETVQGRGFNISWYSEPLAKDGCGNTFDIEDTEIGSIIFDSSTHPALAFGQIMCDWLLYSSVDEGHISLKIVDLHLGYGDFLEVFDGSQPTDTIVYSTQHMTSLPGKITLPQIWSQELFIKEAFTPVIVVSSFASLFIRMTIGKSSSAKLTSSFQKGCNTITPSPVLLQSPGMMNARYPNSMNCSWKIIEMSPSSSLTVLVSPKFHTELNTDILKISTFNDEDKNSVVHYELSGSRDNNVLSISSLHGFYLHFQTDSTVNHGYWSALVSFDCKSLEIPDTVLLSTEETRFGIQVEYSCIQGYLLKGTSHTTCGLNGHWNPSDVPFCEEVACEVPPEIHNGYLISMSGQRYMDIANYKCHHGFSPSGNTTSMCDMHGWTKITHCQEILCPKQNPPSNGNAKAEDLRYGYMREFFCDPGYKMIGSKFSHCDVNGVWSDEVPECEVQRCPHLDDPLNGKWSSNNGLVIGDSVEIVCNPGYISRDLQTLKCKEDLTYEQLVPTCIDIDECLIPGSCGSHKCQNYMGGYSCFCSKGFHKLHNHECIDFDECLQTNGGCSHICLNTPGSFQCQCPEEMKLYEGPEIHLGNQTITPMKSCIDVCGPLSVRGGSIIYSRMPLSSNFFLYGTKAVVTCPTGSYPNGDSNVTCVAGHGWSSQITHCEEIQCNKPNEIWNGYVNVTTLKAGGMVTYTCRKGFELKGLSRRFCRPQLNEYLPQRPHYDWNGITPFCEAVSCPNITQPSYGELFMTKIGWKYVAVFKCICGFHLIGQSVLWCQDNGRWSHMSPRCEAKSCNHPGIPWNADIATFTPGFPVGSTATFKCSKQGYKISDTTPLRCIPVSFSRPSTSKPFLQVSLFMHFTISKESAIMTPCHSAFESHLSQSLIKWVENIIQSNCSNENLVMSVQTNTVTELMNAGVNLSANVTISAMNMTLHDHCWGIIQSCLSSTLLVFDGLIDKLYQHVATCPKIHLDFNSVKIGSGIWQCWSGLKLKFSKESNAPICVEDCIYREFGQIDPVREMKNLIHESSEDIASFSRFNKTGHRTLTPTIRFAYPTLLSSTESPLLKTDHSHKVLPMFKISSSGQLSTKLKKSTTQSTASSTEFSNHRTVDVDPIEEFSHTTKMEIPNTTWSPLEESMLQASKDEMFYRNEVETFSSQGIDSLPRWMRNPNCGRRQINAHNFTGQGPGESERKMSSQSDFFHYQSQDGQADCLTTHSLEKQETIVGHEEGISKANVMAPFYSVEIHDRMKGSFSNITCVDAVHEVVNAKVNKILRLFAQKIGSLVCRNTPNSSLELLAGNIRFKETKARLFVRFGITNTVSLKLNVESCGHEFSSFITSHLPESMAEVGMEVSGNSCRFLNYTMLYFKVKDSGWSCHSGYRFHSGLFQCIQMSAFGRFSQMEKSKKRDFTSVKSVPRLAMHFSGAFALVHEHERITATCLNEYKRGIISAMADVEVHLQSTFLQCANIYIDLRRNISVSIRGKRVIAQATAHLMSLKKSLNMQTITRCYRFLSLYFREPSHILPTVSLGKHYLPTCQEIFLVPHSLRMNPRTAFFCPMDYIYNEQNFKCLHRSSPSYTTGVEVSFRGNFRNQLCFENINQFATQMARDILSVIRGNLDQKTLCKGMTDLLLLEKKAVVEIMSYNVTIAIPVSLTSLEGSQLQTRSCMLDVIHHLNSALKSPLSALLTKMTRICSVPLLRLTQQHRVVYSHWECNPPLIYKHDLGICDDAPQQSQNVQMKGLTSSRTKRQSGLMSGHESGVPRESAWDKDLPYCSDIEPPVFASCPEKPLMVVLKHGHPVPMFLPLPSATDNSGIKPNITFTEPEDFHLPYLFLRNMTIVMTARDDSNNIATCNISVFVIDQVPPVITCPAHTVLIKELPAMPFNDKTVHSYCRKFVQVYDNSKDVNVKFELLPRKNTGVKRAMMITVFAEDQNKNSANCQFYIIVEASCSESTLLRPVNGFKRCVLSGRDRNSLVCAVSCQEGKAFSVQPPLQYICASKTNKWLPHDRVPDCYDSEFSNFELLTVSHYHFGDNPRPRCLSKALKAVQNSLKMLIRTLCKNALQYLTYSIDRTESITNQSGNFMVSSSIKAQLQTKQGTSPLVPPAQWCGNQLLPVIELTINESFSRHCVNVDLVSSFTHGRNICNKRFALAESRCVECPAGTFWVNSECLECPKGRFQPQPGMETCQACPENFSTIAPGTKNGTECIALCPMNMYSVSGLEPCLQCPVGTFQANRGSKYCEKCGVNRSLPHPFCQDLCPVGHMSSTGSYPCNPCPLNYYNSQIAKSHCLPCPNGMITLQNGADSIDQCIEFNPCDHSPCMNEGLCKVTVNEIYCECTPEFTGKLCDTPVDRCQSLPCLNNGSCQGKGQEFQCHCQPGTHCELVVDHCLSNPCDHGICDNLSSGYSCLCFSGFEGKRCHINTDDCLDIFCENSGTCLDEINDFKCECSLGYKGEFCEENINDCEPNQCINGGKCVDGIGTFLCICPEDFQGTFCEHSINNCLSNPCQNEAACLDQEAEFICFCPVGFSGRLCEIETDFCTPNPCRNNGTCIQTYRENMKHFHCHCPEGFFGVLCQYKQDACASMACHSNGTMKCENHVSHHLCHCLPGWTGVLCDMKIDPCSENPCKNEGMCLNHNYSYECKCSDGFNGVFCQTLQNSCLDKPCHNNGKCIQADPSSIPRCLCPPGFSGAWCETNINECEMLPCKNGGTCEDGVNSFFCRCTQSFAGRTCEVDIDECIGRPCGKKRICKQSDEGYQCLCPPDTTGPNCEVNMTICQPNPCQNEGDCTAGEDGKFLCQCAEGFSGLTCAEQVKDDCRGHITCSNGGTCHRRESKYVCLCKSLFTGHHCEKEQSSNFDIKFGGDGSFVEVQSLPLGNASEVSLCLWVQFAKPDGSGTFLSVLSEGKHATIPLLVMNGLQIDLPYTGRLPTIVNINDGLWHHLCVLIAHYQWQIFKDGTIVFNGTNIATGLSLGTGLQVTLGQPVLEEKDAYEFEGSITNAVLSSNSFHSALIKEMSTSCLYHYNNGSIFDWIEIKDHKNKNVLLERPSECKLKCHQREPVEGCKDLLKRVIKSSPRVMYCPRDIKITSMSGPLSVTWNEPVFDDDEGIVALEQNYRSGQAFAHGHYLVTYLALDNDDNSAVCKFQVFVNRFNCKDPAPPLNGARVCGEWDHGRYCIPSCLPNFMFVSAMPPFYHCGQDGIWEPNDLQQQLLTFSECRRTYPPSYVVFGGIQFDGPSCSPSFIQSLNTRLVTILTQLDDIIGLCEFEKPCNYSQGLSSTCGQTSDDRVKRGIKDFFMYNVHFNLTFASQSSKDKYEQLDWISEQVAIALKTSPSLGHFQLQSISFQSQVSCMKGTVAKMDDAGHDKCVECPTDHFVDQSSTCIPCSRGWYNDVPGANICIKCPSHGHKSPNCQGICGKGHYFSATDSMCIRCPRGQYQDRAGQWHCRTCPMGLTTSDNGGDSQSACTDMCLDGEELGQDKCILCPQGWYRNRSSSLMCQPCPYGWTTLKMAATSETQCSFKKCEPGYHMVVDDNRCHPCPQGTFQSLRGKFSCLPCGIGFTTASEGAHSITQCYKGDVDECLLGIDNCSSNSICVDEKEGFTCKCKLGETQNGQCESFEEVSHTCKGGFGNQRHCQCEPGTCNHEGSPDVLRNLVIPCLAVAAAAASFLIILTAVIVAYRWKKRMKESPPIRLYRKEKELTAFSNNVFETVPSQASSLRFDSASKDIFTTNVNVGPHLLTHFVEYFSNENKKDQDDQL